MPKKQKRKGGGFVVTNETIRQTLAEYSHERWYEISEWDVSQVTDMSNLFKGMTTFNVDLSKWDVSNVTNMEGMFQGCSIFDGEGLGDWGEKPSNVRNMSFMFKRCVVFDSNISSWNVANVTNMQSMFEDCPQFSQDMKQWDTIRVTNMQSMFSECELFDGDITNWNVNNVTDMSYMFFGCEFFNQNISSWEISNVTNMAYMFQGCKRLDQDLSLWDLSNVNHIKDMFKGCTNLHDKKYPPEYLALTKPTLNAPRTLFLFNRQSVDQFANGFLRPDIQLLCNNEILEHLTKDDLIEQSKACCAGEIGDIYKVQSFFETLEGPNMDKFQLLCALDKTNHTLIGFIVAELGECRDLRNTWSVRLICVNNQNKKISSTVLLGALLYAIKGYGRQQFVVLELASAYTNIQGFISYSKLGFIKNLSLSCFSVANHLPMYISLKNLTQTDIIDLVTNRKVMRLTLDQDDTGLFEKYIHKTKITPTELEHWNVDYRSRFRHIPKGIVLADQVYNIDRLRGGTRRKRKKKHTRSYNCDSLNQTSIYDNDRKK